jgi:hypothetical protein
MTDQFLPDQHVMFLPMRQDLPPQLRITEEAFWRSWNEAQPHQRAAILARLSGDAAPSEAGRLLEGLRLLMTGNTYETMIAPFIAQEREEHYQAVQRREHRHAQWIVVRMYLLISYNALSGIASSVAGLISKIGNITGA